MNLKPFECILPKECILENEPMKNHTTFRTGGNADVLFVPQTEEQLVSLLPALREHGLSCTLIGRGSNLLVADGGIRGAVVKIAYGTVTQNGNMLTAGAGVPLHTLAFSAAQKSLAGLEFAAGIPGSLGGGIAMNAGAYNGELKDSFVSARILDCAFQFKTLTKPEMCFAYRKSVVLDQGYIVLSACFALQPGSGREIKKRMEELADRRKEKQPLEFPSAGSTFQRPPGAFAGALIEQCGLKGRCIGGAQVSEKHAGFIINKGTASSADIYRLVYLVQQEVFFQTGVTLSPEIRFVGDFDI